MHLVSHLFQFYEVGFIRKDIHLVGSWGVVLVKCLALVLGGYNSIVSLAFILR